MQKDVVAVDIKGAIPTMSGSALFLGNKDKTIVIYMDPSMGRSILSSLNGSKKPRPMTHEFIANILKGLQATIERVVISDVVEQTFFARLILKMTNELGTKIVEVDGRPSDCIILALQAGKSIYVARRVMDALEDMTEVFERISKQQFES
jgi:bifunctional DNase/RNase